MEARAVLATTSRRQAAHSSATLVASALGCVSLFLDWFTFRPNRLAAGSGVSIWDSAALPGAALIAMLWASCLVLGMVARKGRNALYLGFLADVAMVSTAAFAGWRATVLMQGQESFARVSLSGGAWLSLTSAYALTLAASHAMPRSVLWRLWRNVILWSGPASLGLLAASGWMADLSLSREAAVQGPRFLQELARHVLLFGGSVAVGAALGIPLGIAAAQTRYGRRSIFLITEITQTVPSLALFGLLMAPLSALSNAFPGLRDAGIRGVGLAPAMIALTVYALLPIVQNTYAGFRAVDPAAIDAARGMGMGRWQMLRSVQFPLAAPLALEGVRTAAVQAVGNAAVAALIGAGGLGYFIFQGLSQAAPDLILIGTLPVIILALVVDRLMRLAVTAVRPGGLVEVNP